MCSLIGIILGKWSETGLEPLQLHGVYIVLWLITEVFLPLRQRAAAGENSPRLEHSNKVIKKQEHTVLILYGFTVMNHYSISDMLFPLETYNCFKYGRNKSKSHTYFFLKQSLILILKWILMVERVCLIFLFRYIYFQQKNFIRRQYFSQPCQKNNPRG